MSTLVKERTCRRRGAELAHCDQLENLVPDPGDAVPDPGAAAMRPVGAGMAPQATGRDAARQLLEAYLSPAAVRRLRPRMRSRFRDVLDALVDRGGCEFVHDVALRYPQLVLAELLGLPVAEAGPLQEWGAVLHRSDYGAATGSADSELVRYLEDVIVHRRAQPHDDLVSAVLAGDDGNRAPVRSEDVVQMFRMLFHEGLHTAALMTYGILHLGANGDERRRLVGDPTLWPSAVDQLVSFCTLVNPRDRFGPGYHGYLDSNLARAELRIGLAEWHRRIPDYEVLDVMTSDEQLSAAHVDRVPLRWPST